MTTTQKAAYDAAPRLAAGERATYDGVSVALHWITVVLVLVQFALAQTWHFFPRPTHRLMVMLHMSFGTLLGVAVIGRIIWRTLPGHDLPAAYSGWSGVASKTVHYLLYALILFQFVLGFVLRWSGGEAMIFFGLPIPPVGPQVSKATNHFLGDVHNWAGWAIIVIAAGHALIGLFHHFVVKDHVLARMIPALRRA